jgi:uncharacterized protein (DUF302 family)
MKNLLYMLSVFTLLSTPTPVLAGEGMIDIQSDFNVETTVNRLQDILTKKGMTIFKVVEHAKSAAKVAIPLRPTTLVIFGNPKVGSKLMQCGQSIAIDLPQKALIWQDKNNHAWLSYNDMDYLAQRHELKSCDKLIAKVKQALHKLMHKAAKHTPHSY